MRGSRLLILLFGAATVLTGTQSAESDNSILDEDLTITQSQKEALDKFKIRMSPILPKNYMKEELYLVRWLRAKNFDIPQAENFLKEHLKWRKDNQMDRIQQEDFSDLVGDYPAYVDTYDKHGAPVLTAVAGHWNLRQAHLTGQYNRLNRFLFKLMDECSQKLYQAQLEGKNITRFHVLLNLDGFNLVQHGCPRCVWGIITFLQAYENHFPGMTDRIIVFNATPAIQALRPVVRGVISNRTRGNIQLIGTNKAEWLPALLKFIDASQLTEEFGGTRVRKA